MTSSDDTNDRLAAFGVPLVTRSSIRSAATSAGVSLESAQGTSYVSVKPAGASQIAVYAHKTKVSIALNPADAEEAVKGHGPWRLEPGSATSYVHIDHELVDGSSVEVEDLIRRAFLR